ncbi:MAG: hypothetical protein IPM02_04090 [Betaproteobacteria bacterium]|nr:hypothetical protein [Betaproteobacteria bacterium]
MIALIGGLLWLLSLSASAAAPHALWRLNPGAGAQFVNALRQGVYPIEFDSRALEEWPLGESGDLALPGGRMYQIKGDRIEEHASGNRTWIGKIEEQGKVYVAVLTYGPAGLVGEVRTPDGPVVLVMEDSQHVMIDTSAAGWRTPEVTESDAMIQPSPLIASGSEVGSPIELKAAPAPQTTIDVLIAYTHAMVTRAGSTAGALLRLDQLIATANQAYFDSEVAITLRLVHAEELSYTETDDNSVALTNLTNGAGVLASVQGTLRDRYGADIVVLVRPSITRRRRAAG